MSTLEQYAATGRFFEAAGVRSFVLDEGAGDPVVCLHGVPASAYLYRKVVPALATRGLRGVAFDLPGLGLADRPQQFAYTFTGLGRWSLAAVDALALDRFHLVVHDIGGPVGFELASAVPERVASLTVLNTLIDTTTFRKPWMMAPFAVPGLGEVYLRTMVKPAFRRLMRRIGVWDQRAVSDEELDVYVDLLKRADGGRAFLRIMRGFELGEDKQRAYRAVVGSDRYPVQVVWGEHDTALRVGVRGEQARRAAGLADLVRLPGRHFLQEDNADAIADAVAALARKSG